MRALRLHDLYQAVVTQHDELRARLEALTTRADPSAPPWARQELGILLVRLAARADEHLAFEERELAPRIRALDAWGSAREAALLAEHREQRERFERVCALAEDPRAATTPALAEAVRVLAESLLEDMVHEEHFLAELASIEDDSDVYVDQMAG